MYCVPVGECADLLEGLFYELRCMFHCDPCTFLGVFAMGFLCDGHIFRFDVLDHVDVDQDFSPVGLG